MSPQDREKRIEAACRAVGEAGYSGGMLPHLIAVALDAVDVAVPIVSEAEHELIRDAWDTETGVLEARAEVAEAAARDFAEVLRQHYVHCATGGKPARDALAAHPSFAGKPAARSSGSPLDGGNRGSQEPTFP